MHQIASMAPPNGTQYENLPSPGQVNWYDNAWTALLKSPIEEKLSEEDEGEESEDNPLLFVDVNLGPERSEWIVVYDGDTAEGLAEEFSKKYQLNQTMKQKLIQLLQTEISGLLSRIDEESDENN